MSNRANTVVLFMFFSINTLFCFIFCSYLILNILKPQKQCNARPNSSAVKAKPFLHWFSNSTEDFLPGRFSMPSYTATLVGEKSVFRRLREIVVSAERILHGGK